MFDMLKLGYTRLLIGDIRAQLIQDEHLPSSKSISNKIDKLGFRDYREHSRIGSCYNITNELFTSIVLPIAPNILIDDSSQEILTNDNEKYSSHSSHSSHIEEFIEDNKDVTNNKDVMNVTKKTIFQQKRRRE